MALRLLGRGRVHAVWRYEGNDTSLAGSVLRLRHVDGQACDAPLAALAAELSPEYLYAPLAKLCLSEEVAFQLCEGLRRSTDPPRHTSEAAIAAMVAVLRDGAGQLAGTVNAWVERDHTLACAGCPLESMVCIELKPKAGVLPAGAPLADLTPRRCRFCLYCAVKAQRKRKAAEAGVATDCAPAEAAASSAADVVQPATSASLSAPPSVPDGARHEYCPLDLYSADSQRIARAVDALLCRPRNNLRVVDPATGRGVYGGEGNVHDSTAGAALPAAYPRSVLRALLVAILADAPLTRLLARLRAAQARPTVGSVGAQAMFERGCHLAGSEGRLSELVAACQTGPCAPITCAVADEAAAAAAQGDSSEASAIELQQCVRGLCDWLLGLSASDVSLMISIARMADMPASADSAATPNSDGTPHYQPPFSSGDHCISIALPAAGVATVARFRYRVAVVDASPKPLAKVREHAEIDAAIVRHWCQPAVAHALHVVTTCEPPPLPLPPSISSVSAAALTEGRHSMQPPTRCAAILVVAFGTRGDVLPLVALARALLKAGDNVLFASHACYRTLVLGASSKFTDCGKPAQSSSSSSSSSNAEDGDIFGNALDPRGIGQLRFIGAATDPLHPQTGSSGSDACDASKAAHVDEEYAPILQALRAPPSPLISLALFNLFSLGAWHLAEALHTPAVAISPCIIPYSPPATFAKAFRRAHPQLHATLARVPPPSADDAHDADKPSHAAAHGPPGWEDVMAWMWPMWDVDKWGAWRQRALGLNSPTPLHALTADGSNANNSMEGVRATPLLYAISPALVPRPAYWPSAIRVVGFVTDAHRDALYCRLCAPAAHALLSSHMAADGVRPMYVGFGSCSALLCGVSGGSASLASAICLGAVKVARERRCGLVLHCCGCDALFDTWLAALQAQGGCTVTATTAGEVSLRCVAAGNQLDARNPEESAVLVVLVRGELPLEWALACCDAAVHHGGMGTCASALRAGVAQLLLPLIFDQFANAERMVHSGMAERLRRAPFDAGGSEASAAELTRALHATIQPAAAAARRTMRDELLREDGLSAALAAIAAERAAWEGRQAPPDRRSPRGTLPPAKEHGSSSGSDASVNGSNGDGGGSDVSIEAQLVRLPPGQVDGVQVWCHAPAEALHIYDEIYVRECYLPPASGIRLPTGRELIVDAGANIGLFSLWAAARAPLATMLAVEPAAPTVELLRRNVRASGAAGRVHIVDCALGAALGVGRLTWYERMPGNSTLHPQLKEAEAERCFRPERREAMLRIGAHLECSVRPLSDVLAAHEAAMGVGAAASSTEEGGLPVDCVGSERLPVALLKVDVEGSEVDVLHGVASHDWPRVRQVVVETHGAAARLETRRLLSLHYEAVGEVLDAELEQCGLDRAIVYAHTPSHRVPCTLPA